MYCIQYYTGELMFDGVVWNTNSEASDFLYHAANSDFDLDLRYISIERTTKLPW